MFYIIETNNYLREVAEAEDLASARKAVVHLLSEGETELTIESPDGLILESCRLDDNGNPVWKSNDLVRAFDGRGK